MNPLFRVGDDRIVVWTVSENDPNLYCIYICSQLIHEDLPFDTFYSLYKNALKEYL